MSRRTTVLAILGLLWIAGATRADEGKDFSFHGIKLGESESAVTAKYPEFKCAADPGGSDLRHCRGAFVPAKYPGVFKQLNGTLDTLLTFHADKLVNISVEFYAKLFEPGSLFFIQYYGQPKMTRTTVKDTKGSERENTTLLWMQGPESIVYWKIDEGRFTREGNDSVSRILFVLKE